MNLTDSLAAIQYTADDDSGCVHAPINTPEGPCVHYHNENGVRARMLIRRALYQQAHGSLERGDSVKNTCGNRSCVALQHAYVEKRSEITARVAGRKRKDPVDSINYIVDEQTGCWNVVGKTTPQGYLPICRRRDGVTRTLYAHRVMYEIHKGKIPNGLNVCHSCDNPKCCNPDHLWLGTDKENAHDALRKGRHKQNPLTHTQVIRIIKRRRWKHGDISNIARLLGVRREVVLNIATGRTWKWLREQMGTQYLTPTYQPHAHKKHN